MKSTIELTFLYGVGKTELQHSTAALYFPYSKEEKTLMMVQILRLYGQAKENYDTASNKILKFHANLDACIYINQ